MYSKSDFSEHKQQLLVIEAGAEVSDRIYSVLSCEYLVSYSRCEDALDKLRSDPGKTSLILLEVKTAAEGIRMLNAISDDEALRHIPVIVLSDKDNAEIPCLKAGASDFILLPCFSPEVVLLRARRFADPGEIPCPCSDDELTGIPNRNSFFRLAEEYDALNPDKPMDAVCVDISGFHIINSLFGHEYGNRILIVMAEELVQIAKEEHAVVGRKTGDIFLLYMPHRDKYKGLLMRLQDAMGEKMAADPDTIRLKMGIYSNVDKSIDIYSRFDRAKHARDTMHYSFSQIISYYDGDKYREDMTSQQLLLDFDSALRNHQFKVYYQPKFSIAGEKPELISAEALVRWHHPTMGVLFPGAFIPLFEDNGLVSRLDRYVWEETAAQIRRWRDKFGIHFPVSINVSRNDLVDTDLRTIFFLIVRKNGIDPSDLLIEITESAYTKNVNNLVEQIDNLHAAGFRIGMDDFGTGYSSLNMLSTIPVDAIKLDIEFIRNMFENEKNLQMLRMMMQIKETLHLPIVAEGVETEEQLMYLKSIGCDIVQGYYFSKPILPDEFEKFIHLKLGHFH